MAWLILLLAVDCLTQTFLTSSVALGLSCVLLGLFLGVIAMMMLLSARVAEAPRIP